VTIAIRHNAFDKVIQVSQSGGQTDEVASSMFRGHTNPLAIENRPFFA